MVSSILTGCSILLVLENNCVLDNHIHILTAPVSLAYVFVYTSNFEGPMFLPSNYFISLKFKHDWKD